MTYVTWGGIHSVTFEIALYFQLLIQQALCGPVPAVEHQITLHQGAILEKRNTFSCGG